MIRALIVFFALAFSSAAFSDTLIGTWACKTRPAPENYKLDTQFKFGANQDYELIAIGRGPVPSGEVLDFTMRLTGTWRLDGRKIYEENVSSAKFIRFDLDGRNALNSEMAAQFQKELLQELAEEEGEPMVLESLKGKRMRMREGSATLRCKRVKS